MLRQFAAALPISILLFSKRKAKTPQHATRIAQHELRNTIYATQHASPGQGGSFASTLCIRKPSLLQHTPLALQYVTSSRATR
jgi:hypothetical protein